MSFGYELIFETDRLEEFPAFGRIVPEYRDDDIRENTFRPYRIVDRVNHDAKLCEIARVWHSARGLLQFVGLSGPNIERLKTPFSSIIEAHGRTRVRLPQPLVPRKSLRFYHHCSSLPSLYCHMLMTRRYFCSSIHELETLFENRIIIVGASHPARIFLGTPVQDVRVWWVVPTAEC